VARQGHQGRQPIQACPGPRTVRTGSSAHDVPVSAPYTDRTRHHSLQPQVECKDCRRQGFELRGLTSLKLTQRRGRNCTGEAVAVAFEFGFLLWINSFPEIQTQQRSEVQSARGATTIAQVVKVFLPLCSTQKKIPHSNTKAFHCTPPYSNSERGNQS